MYFTSSNPLVAHPEDLKSFEPGTDDIVIYTDGSCWYKTKVGSYAAIINYRRYGIMSTHIDAAPEQIATQYVWGQYHGITNNIAELLGIYHGLAAIPENLNGSHVIVCSDSEWAIRCLNGQYKRRMYTEESDFPVNWPMIDRQAARFVLPPENWKHVKGHAGNLQNEMCDLLCEYARNGIEITDKVFQQLRKTAQERSRDNV